MALTKLQASMLDTPPGYPAVDAEITRLRQLLGAMG